MGNGAKDYRPDIDGMRAVAVGAVLLFHAGIPGFSGGYVGVDVFFVISGFLITSILWRECEAGKFSLVKFYERRIRRIMPALLATLVLTLIGGAYFLGVQDYANLAKTVLATLAFVSNIKFWRGSGYFEGASELQPLLHTWSLAIEEQFYLFWPILLFAIHRYARLWLGPAVWFMTLSSVLLSAVGVFLSPSATFFLPPTRIWELSLGALVALRLFPSLGRWSNAASAIGLALILVPVFAYDRYTLFPGLTALPPCLGTAMLIEAGRDRQSAVGRLLSARPIVAIGLVSYSLYLVHFPVLAYLRHWNLGELPLAAGIAGLAVSLFLAALSYRYVEQPFRNRATVSALGVWRFALVGNSLVASAAFMVILDGGFPARFAPERLALVKGSYDVDLRSRDCLNTPVGAVMAKPSCALGRRDAPPDAFVWGDSHAAALSPALDPLFARLGYSGRLVAFNACPPLIGYEPKVLSWADRKRCADRNRDFLSMMRDRKEPALIIIHGFWSSYASLMDGQLSPDTTAAIRRNLDALSRHRVFIVLDTPRTGTTSLPTALAFGQKTPVIDRSTDDVVSMALRSAAFGKATVLDPSGAVCSRRPCDPLIDGRPILSDSNHVAASIARDALTPFFASALRGAGSQGRVLVSPPPAAR